MSILIGNEDPRKDEKKKRHEKHLFGSGVTISVRSQIFIKLQGTHATRTPIYFISAREKVNRDCARECVWRCLFLLSANIVIVRCIM